MAKSKKERKIYTEIFLRNDDGGEMTIKGRYTIDECLDIIFKWMAKGWYMDNKKGYLTTKH